MQGAGWHSFPSKKKYFWAPSIVFRDRNKDVQPRTADWRYETDNVMPTLSQFGLCLTCRAMRDIFNGGFWSERMKNE